MSAMARGATLAVTEITPAAPTPMASRAVRSSPLSTLEVRGAGRDQLAHARGLTHGFLDARDAAAARDRRATVAGSISTAVRLGTLYSSTGTLRVRGDR